MAMQHLEPLLKLLFLRLQRVPAVLEHLDLRGEREGPAGKCDVPAPAVLELDAGDEVVFLLEGRQFFLDGVQGRAEGVDLGLLRFYADFEVAEADCEDGYGAGGS